MFATFRGMERQLITLFPALAFLVFGVPLAILLDRVGFFEACADRVLERNPSVLKLWVLAAATTIVLNLDTTIVILTPLYLHIARKSRVDPVPIVAIPVLLASLASSPLPVSNLTNLIVIGAFHVSSLSFIAHLGLPTLMAVLVGWLLYRRRFTTKLTRVLLDKRFDQANALKIGGLVVGGLLIGFLFGPQVGIDAWMVALAADTILVLITRSVPWRAVPLALVAAVAVIGSIVAVVIPAESLRPLFGHTPTIGTMLMAAGLATLGANTINNLPSVLIGVHGSSTATWGLWAWLIGVNIGAILLPVGALATLLWMRILKQNGIVVPLRKYLSISLPIGLPVLIVSVLTLIIEYKL